MAADTRVGIQQVGIPSNEKPLTGAHKYGEMGPSGTNGHHKFSGPTVHNGWTAEPARRAESDARINKSRAALRGTNYTPFVK